MKRIIANGLEEMEGNSIVCGDFNLCGTSAENVIIPSDYIDVWPHLHPSLPGWTEDTVVNEMRFRHSGRHKQVRFDRILYHRHQPHRSANQVVIGEENVEMKYMRASSIELVGTSCIDGSPIWPSDHFGLFASFDIY